MIKPEAHLQTHLSNFYIVGGKPYLMDWATSRALGGNAEENITNRLIDLKRRTDDYMRIFSSLFDGLPEKVLLRSNLSVKEIAMQAYSENPEKEIDFLSAWGSYAKLLGKNLDESELMALWMKDEGIEGYPKAGEVRKPMVKPKKVGRNERCPCGSGKKFKYCCG